MSVALARSVTREGEAIKRKQTFLLIRYVLILATGALAFAELPHETSPIPVALLIGVALLSNIVLGGASPHSFFDAWMQAPVLIADTAMISLALLLTHAEQQSFFFFFFILIMAAKVESMVTLGICATLVGLASFLGEAASGGWAEPALMRIPFMFATAVFFGYVVLPERTGEMNSLNRKKPTPTKRTSSPLIMAGMSGHDDWANDA